MKLNPVNWITLYIDLLSHISPCPHVCPALFRKNKERYAKGRNLPLGHHPSFRYSLLHGELFAQIPLIPLAALFLS